MMFENPIFFAIVITSCMVVWGLILFADKKFESVIHEVFVAKKLNSFSQVKKGVVLTFPDKSGAYHITDISLVRVDNTTGDEEYAIKTQETGNEVLRYKNSQLKISSTLYDLAMDKDIVVQILPDNYEHRVNERIAFERLKAQQERDLRIKQARHLKDILEQEKRKIYDVKRIASFGSYDFNGGYIAPYGGRLAPRHAYEEPVEEEVGGEYNG